MNIWNGDSMVTYLPQSMQEKKQGPPYLGSPML